MNQNSINKESNTRESARLDSMPYDIMELIMSHLDLNQRFKLRKVSKTLRALVDVQSWNFSKVDINIEEGRTSLVFDAHKLIYSDGTLKYGPTEIKIAGKLWCQAIDDLASILKSPRIHIKNLNISISEACPGAKKILEDPSSIFGARKVENVYIRSRYIKTIYKLLTVLEPSTLKNIDVGLQNSRFGENIRDGVYPYPGAVRNVSELMELDQVQQAREINTYQFATVPMPQIPKFLCHEKFKVAARSINAQLVRDIVTMLYDKENFRRGDLYFVERNFRMPTREIAELFRKEIGDGEKLIVTRKIRNSTDYLKLCVEDTKIVITRNTRRH